MVVLLNLVQYRFWVFMACMTFSLEFYVRHTNVIQSTLQTSRIDNSFVNYMHVTTKLVHKCLVVHSHLSDEALKKVPFHGSSKT